MESTLFTALSANEEANLSGGKIINITVNNGTFTATGGAGGAGGTNSGSGKIIVTGGTIQAGPGGAGGGGGAGGAGIIFS